MVYERHNLPDTDAAEAFGTNWRILEMQAVIERIHLKRMTESTYARGQNAAAIAKPLKPFSDERGAVRLPDLADEALGSPHAQYRFYAYVRPENLAEGWGLDRIVSEVVGRGVPCYQGSFSEVYLEKSVRWNRLAAVAETAQRSGTGRNKPNVAGTSAR